MSPEFRGKVFRSHRKYEENSLNFAQFESNSVPDASTQNGRAM